MYQTTTTVYRDPSGCFFDGRALPVLEKANMTSSNLDADDDVFHGGRQPEFDDNNAMLAKVNNNGIKHHL